MFLIICVFFSDLDEDHRFVSGNCLVLLYTNVVYFSLFTLLGCMFQK